LEAAKKTLDQLYSLKRPDYAQNLSFWDTEIAKARLARAPSSSEPELQVTMAAIDGPVWLKPASHGREIFGEKPSDAPVVAFLGSTVEQLHKSDTIQRQMADAPGRMSRALPLFLAEQVWFRTSADVKTFVPFIMSQPRGFILSGVPWRDEDAVKYSLQGGTRNSLVAIAHLRCVADPWTIELRLIRSDDHEVVGKLSKDFESAKPEEAVPEIALQLVSLISVSTSVEIQKPPKTYSVPSGAQFRFYLLRLEQLLAVRLAAMEGTGANFLNGERDILQGNLQLCIDCPDNVGTRFLLARTVLAMKAVRPDLIGEFKDKIILLNRKKPLKEPALGVLEQMFNEAFAT